MSLLWPSCILLLYSVTVSASYNVEVLLNSYTIPSSKDCDGCPCKSWCEELAGDDTCDSVFTFCLHSSGITTCLDQNIASELENDMLVFKITNPVIFQNLDIVEPLQLVVTVKDNTSELIVDQITIQLDQTLTFYNTVSILSTSGSCKVASVDLSYQITSNCAENLYGPTCSKTCIPISSQYYCSYLGQRQCLENYYPPNCETFCMPQDDSEGHFTCDLTNGKKICLSGYSDVTTNCTTEDDDSSSEANLRNIILIPTLLVLVFVVIPAVAIAFSCVERCQRDKVFNGCSYRDGTCTCDFDCKACVTSGLKGCGEWIVDIVERSIWYLILLIILLPLIIPFLPCILIVVVLTKR